MTDDSKRAEEINKRSAELVRELIVQIDDGKITNDDLIVQIYSHMVVSYLIGLDPSQLLIKANEAANKIVELASEGEEDE